MKKNLKKIILFISTLTVILGFGFLNNSVFATVDLMLQVET